jgi:hypothetical protein
LVLRAAAGVPCPAAADARAALLPRPPLQAPKLSPAQQLAQRKNKQGNPFEFLGLLMSLTKRW